MRFGFVCAWYDFWVGVYFDRTKRRLYVLPIPCVGFWVGPRPTLIAGPPVLLAGGLLT